MYEWTRLQCSVRTNINGGPGYSAQDTGKKCNRFRDENNTKLVQDFTLNFRFQDTKFLEVMTSMISHSKCFLGCIYIIM